MIRSLRQTFNASWNPQKHHKFLACLESRTGIAPQFRHSETPVFLPSDLVGRMAQSGREIIESLLGNPEYLAAADAVIPERWRVPNEAPVPMFLQVDFGIDEHGNPQLVEIQGFPSLYAYQPLLAQCYAEAYGIDLPYLPHGLSLDRYRWLFREAVVGNHDPENVVLLEIDPEHQKTRADFTATERLACVRTVDIQNVRKRGRQLIYKREGREIPIRRIYNRAIADELERRDVTLPFEFHDDLDVEWAGHPNWFYKISKFSLPYLKHSSVPETMFLDRAGEIADPSQYVLKPLFSFAGSGVIVGPTRERIAAVPEKHRHDYVLQRRVNFSPVLETPHGPTKIEVRIMYIWLDQLYFVNTVVRSGRGAQMGVDFNKGLEWVGATAAFLG